MQLLGSMRIRTAAYHPSANGLVERFHRQLKSSLKAYPRPVHWADALPFVLLGIRTALKDDIRCSTAELVYGTTLCLPGEFFNADSSSSVPDPAEYVARLKAVMGKLRAAPVRKQALTKTYVAEDLSSCTHVYIRHDGVRKPLRPPYDGPYKVLQRGDKYFTVEVKGTPDTISLDRLKPARLEIPITAASPTATTASTSSPNKTPTQPTPMPQTLITRSGRHVHWPKRYISSFIVYTGGGVL